MVRLLSPLCALALILAGAFVCIPQACAQQVVLLDFTLATCAPCRQMDPVVARLEAEGFDVRRVDGDRQRQIAAQYRVDRYPTFVLLSGGREVQRFVGVRGYAEVRAMLLQAGARPAGVAAGVVAAGRSGVAPATFATPVAGMSPSGRAEANFDVGSDLGPVPEVTIPGVNTKTVAPAPQPLANRATQGPDAARLLSAGVRIKVADGGGSSFGTGTIIDARQGQGLVLTCAHLFRNDANPGAPVGQISVEIFEPTAGGVRVVERVAGEVLSTDAERDVALVTIRLRSSVQPARVAASSTTAVRGAAVWSVGCDHGADPTVRTGRILTTDRYQSPPSLTATGAPVVGRSGGGLFNEQGELVGVCFGASEPDDEGFYAKLSSIHGELDKLGLTAIYREGDPAAGLAAAEPLGSTATPSPLTVASETPQADNTASQDAWGSSELVPVQAMSDAAPPLFRGQTAPMPPSSLTGLAKSEQAALEELARRARESEVVCVIRPREAGGKSEVITLDRVSPQFLQALDALRSAERR